MTIDQKTFKYEGHPFVRTPNNELVVGQRYQYKEDWHIYHFIFLGDESSAEKYGWKIQFDDGPYKGSVSTISGRKDMTGHYYSGMPTFMPENTYMTQYNRDFFFRK